MTVVTEANAVAVTQGLLAVGLLVQTTELWLMRRLYDRGGALAGPSVIPGLCLRFALAGALLPLLGRTTGWLPFAVHAALLLNSAWLTIRSRGPVCGGSDSMWFQVQLGVTVAHLPPLGALGPKLGLAYIAAQSVLSYVLAGWSKVRNPRWWNGQTLRALFASDGPYELLAPLRQLADRPIACHLLGVAVILLQLGAGAVLLLPGEWRWPLLAGLGAFHLFNAVALGLNRFVWAWFATYPALLAVGV